MRVGETAAAEIRHWIGLAPDHIVEDPKPEILHHRADAEDVVVGADHPDGAGGLEHTPAGVEPALGEGVIVAKLSNLSQSSVTASTCESSGRLRSFASWRL